MLHLADELGCDFIATGHYARIAERDGHVYLRKAVDTRKDQTYFLWMLTEEQLRRTIFPLGEYTKDQVREIARSHGYEQLAVKRESQEICFIPDDDYRAFLRASVPDYNERVRAGEYVDAEGKVLGTHEGFVNYTIGQRKGLGIALGHPAYVTHIDAEHNRVTLGTNDDLLATGGTAAGIAKSLNGEVIDGRRVVVKEFVFLVELPALGGRKILEAMAPVRSLVSLEGVE